MFMGEFRGCLSGRLVATLVHWCAQSGRTALIIACGNGHTECAHALLASGANTAIKDTDKFVRGTDVMMTRS